jgi:hypothetical protein
MRGGDSWIAEHYGVWTSMHFIVCSAISTAEVGWTMDVGTGR